MNRWNSYALRETGGATYSGAERGVGARFDLSGRKSGSGHIEGVEATPVSLIVVTT